MMTPTFYHDFRLTFESDGKGLRTRLAWSPVGSAEAPLKLPAAIPRGNLSDRQYAEERGAALFRAVFAGAVGEKYRRSLDLLQGFGGHGLRIRVTIDSHQPEAGKLLAKPWEELFDPEAKFFLSRSRKTTLVRDSWRPLALRPSIQNSPETLVIVAPHWTPPGASEISGTEEIEQLEQAWEDYVEVIQHSTQRELRRQLVYGPCSVVHVIAHGGIQDGEGGVWLDGDETGKVHFVSATTFADVVRDIPELRLVILNACSTDAAPTGDPARSVALKMMEAGVPAVVAQRREIEDDVAVVFGAELGREIVMGSPIDVAVAEARMAVDERDLFFTEWNVPVLYLAAPDGRIFDHRPRLDPGRVSKDPAPLRLAVRSFRHPFDDLRAQADHLLDLTPSFARRAIRAGKDWSEIVQPALEDFLRRHVTTRRSVEIRLDSHLSIAFAAGYAVNTRGVELTIRQATMGGFQDWRLLPGEPAGEDAWIVEEGELRSEATREEVAVAVGITHDNAKDVERHVERHLKRSVQRIVTARTSVVGHAAIRDGAHAFALAEDLSQRLALLLGGGRRPLVHLFLAAPGGFAFFLGQVSRNLGRIRLYEFNFDGDRRYRRSIDLGKAR